MFCKECKRGCTCCPPHRRHANLYSRFITVVALTAATALTQDNAAQGQSSAAAGTGKIAGTVALAPSIAARRARPRLYTGYGQGSSATAVAADTNELLSVVIYVELAPGTVHDVVGRGDRSAMRQRNEAFVPHVLSVLRGTTVAFPNDDPFFHNVFSLSQARAFDLGRYARGKSKTVAFSKSGIVQVFCHIHADMTAVVLVLDNPFFVTPDSIGRFEIDKIPAGDHRIVAWHERTGPVTRAISVRKGQPTVVDFRLPETSSGAAR